MQAAQNRRFPVTAHLIEPPQPLLPGILQKLRQRAQVFYLKKATSWCCCVTGAGLLVRRPVHFRNLVRSC